MAMTDAEKRRVLTMLDKMDKQERDRVIASIQAFASWLERALINIYKKIKGAIAELWGDLVELLE